MKTRARVLHPVSAILVGRPRERPVVGRTVGGGLEHMRGAHPASDPDRRRARIAIGNVQQCKAGKAIVKDNADLFLDAFAGEPAQDMACASAVHVIHLSAALILEREPLDAPAVRQPQGLARFELRERLGCTAMVRDDAAAQRCIELEAHDRVAHGHRRIGGKSESRVETGQAGAGNRSGQELEDGSPAGARNDRCRHDRSAHCPSSIGARRERNISILGRIPWLQLGKVLGISRVFGIPKCLEFPSAWNLPTAWHVQCAKATLAGAGVCLTIDQRRRG
jgi:hypothetical protein